MMYTWYTIPPTSTKRRRYARKYSAMYIPSESGSQDFGISNGDGVGGMNDT